MTGSEKIINLMRDEGSKRNGKGIRLGTMINSKELKIGDLVIDDDDYVKNSTITALAKNDEVLVCKLNDELYAIICKVV